MRVRQKNGHTTRKLGFGQLTGIEHNPKVAESTRSRGYEVYAPERFDPVQWREHYDCIVFSHIIEHFQHDGLLKFMDCYLDCLKPGGYAVMLSPLPGAHFYLDFDHVKPYCPQSVTTVFGPGQRQIQERSRHILSMEGRGFSTFPLADSVQSGLDTQEKSILAPACKFFAGRAVQGLGQNLRQKTGWLGLFRKH